ncbi:hypothetical protein Rt10032_c08g3502 [Rhodotorula toruloides]|uniref:Uncharacterized protein n=1 Tax=Rhodotorula toruloides TaxID=5286 RepID=A0A511KHR6_RHOTO|nr:hypothetical protein Rt10032_c08g3502 [Rhodotorula toruloides]
MRPSPGLFASAREVLSRSTAAAVSGETRGGASKLVRPALKHPHGLTHPPITSPPSRGAQVRHASTFPSSWRRIVEAFVESVYGGTFKAIRSSVRAACPGPYVSSRLAPHPRPVNARFTHSSPRPSFPRTHFGPVPRPSPGHASTRTGLGTARQFSTGGFGVWDNVVQNVPLALRAAADQWGERIDARKWKRVKRDIRRAARGEKGIGWAPGGFDARMEKRAEFERYFGAREEEEEEEGKPVTLILAIDPDFDLSLAPPSSSHEERLLSHSLLDSLESISHAYTTHSHRLRTVINRLAAAGLLDSQTAAQGSLGVWDGSEGLEEHQGRRVWRVEFRDRLATRSRVERVVLGSEAGREKEGEGQVPHWAGKVQRWSGRNTVEAGEGEWWWLVGGAEPIVEEDDVLASTPPLPASFLASPTSPSTPSYPRSSSEDSVMYAIDAAAALAVAQTFVLPSPASLALSHSSSSESSASEVEEEDGPVVWDLSTSLTETETETATATEHDVDDEFHELSDPAASVWAETEPGSYEDGVRTFLSEVEGEMERKKFDEGMAFV